MSVLRASQITMAFGGVRALTDVDIELREGENLGLLGPNGSGKTTLLNVLTGIYRQTSGTVELDGRNISTMKPAHRARSGVLRTFQHPQLAHSLTVRENVAAGVGVGDGDSSRTPSVDEALELFGCAAYAERLPTETPYGFLKLVEIARAIVAAPRVLLLDEPAAGLNADERVELIEALERYRAGHDTAICVIEHDVELVRRLCSRLVVLESGTLLAEGPTAETLASPDVIAAYLGEEKHTQEAR